MSGNAGQTLTPAVAHGYRTNISATLSPAVDQQLLDLLAAVVGQGPGNSLAAKLKQLVVDAVGADKPRVCAALGSFVNEVKAQAGKKLTIIQALVLTIQANTIRAVLDC